MTQTMMLSLSLSLSLSRTSKEYCAAWILYVIPPSAKDSLAESPAYFLSASLAQRWAVMELKFCYILIKRIVKWKLLFFKVAGNSSPP